MAREILAGAFRDVHERGLTVDDLTDERADEAYENYRQREVDAEADAADALRAHEDALKRQQPPVPQPCHACGHKYAGAVCNICDVERPAFTALKALSQPKALPAPLPFCSYYPKALCGCGLRGTCLETA